MTYKFQISLLASCRKLSYICIDNTLLLNQKSIFMNSLKKISSLICLLLLGGQMLYAQISVGYESRQCFSMGIEETLNDEIQACYQIIIEFDALELGQPVYIKAINPSNDSVIYESSCTSECSIEWCFTRADFINVIDFECSTSPQTTAGTYGAITDTETDGGCKQVDGCIVIIGGYDK